MFSTKSFYLFIYLFTSRILIFFSITYKVFNPFWVYSFFKFLLLFNYSCMPFLFIFNFYTLSLDPFWIQFYEVGVEIHLQTFLLCYVFQVNWHYHKIFLFFMVSLHNLNSIWSTINIASILIVDSRTIVEYCSFGYWFHGIIFINIYSINLSIYLFYYSYLLYYSCHIFPP